MVQEGLQGRRPGILAWFCLISEMSPKYMLQSKAAYKSRRLIIHLPSRQELVSFKWQETPTSAMLMSRCNRTFQVLTDQNFNFQAAWQYTKDVNATCPWDPRLFGVSSCQFDINSPLLTYDATKQFVGAAWSAYPFIDVWNRITTWKTPELQLVVMFPRPPLSFSVELMVITHFLGDPIDTIQHLHLTLYNCQRTADFWKPKAQEIFGEDNDEGWKALGIIEATYAEWAREMDAREVLYMK